MCWITYMQSYASYATYWTQLTEDSESVLTLLQVCTKSLNLLQARDKNTECIHWG